jgi:hypothetical protein
MISIRQVPLAVFALPALLALSASVVFAQSVNTDALPPDNGYGRVGGQNVQPFFEGWQRQPGGRLVMWFGYLNRNFDEQVDVPVGSDNKFDLRADMGQPSHFYPRRRLFVFKVDVPDNWPADKKLVWSVTAHGRNSSASGWLQPEWEVDEGVMQMNIGPGGAPPDPPNSPPKVTVKGDTTVAVGKTLRIAATASDDGIPPARRRSPVTKPAQAPAPMPLPPGAAPRPRAQLGLRINWILYRAPETGGSVTFEEDGTKPEMGGKAAELATSATFSAPGTYWLRAIASDGLLETPYDFKVTVLK